MSALRYAVDVVKRYELKNDLLFLIEIARRSDKEISQQAILRLRKLIGLNLGDKAETYEKWFFENQEYMYWCAGDEKYSLNEEQKKWRIPKEYWLSIPEKDRNLWEKYTNEERNKLILRAENNLSSEYQMRDRAWEQDVPYDLWILISKDVRARWQDLTAENKEMLIAEAEKKLLEQEAKGNEEHEQDAPSEEAPPPAEPEP